MNNDFQPPPPQSQQQSPIGMTVMETRVLKEPRGFMKILEFFFAIAAFAACAHFSTTLKYSVTCVNSTTPTIEVEHNLYYPFKLDHEERVTVTCGNVSKNMGPLGDWSSDAQFFVFIGVVAFLGAMATLVVYVFFSQIYLDDSKRAPMFDFFFTVIMAICWLAASSAWANGVISAKYEANPENWIFSSSDSICKKTGDVYDYKDVVEKCDVIFAGKFGGANSSILLGFLNVFLWGANLWFIYKETSWFAARANPPGQQMPA